jgi:hypothetical protein
VRASLRKTIFMRKAPIGFLRAAHLFLDFQMMHPQAFAGPSRIVLQTAGIVGRHILRRKRVSPV